MRSLAAAVLASLLPLSAGAGSDTSLRCPGGIVSLGDHTVDLLGKCGEPALREGGVETTTAVYRTQAGRERRATAISVERWTYDFGPSAFLMFVTVEGGRITAIWRGSWGYAKGPPAAAALRRATCDPSALSVGLSKLDVLARCGSPALAERRDDVIRVTAGPSAGVAVTTETPVVAEVWTYDFGPQTLVRFVSLEDGVVVRVETGGHGYAR